MKEGLEESNSITTRLTQYQQKQRRRSYSQKQEQEQKQNKQNQDHFSKVVDNKIDIVMKDIPGCNWIKKSLLDRKIISLQNANTICDYVLACKSEDSISTNTCRNILTTLTTFLKWTSKHYYKTTPVPFSDMTRDTIKLYFDSLQKPDTADPTHKWKGTYNMKVPGLQKFYRWLYSPNTNTASSNQTRRPLPDQVSGFRMLKRKEATGYSPSHLWTKEEHKIFLKYCPDIRFKAWHAMSLDTSARPHELLNLKIKDLKERPMAAVKDQMGNILRPECVLFQFTVNGKTGTRSLGLMESMPYVLDWLDKHPEKANKDAYLFSSYTKIKRGKSTSSRISTGYVCWIYTRRYRLEYFPKLLDDPNVPQQDKDIIKVMLQERRWNPYALRHFSLTDKTKQRLKSDGMLRQHAGWTKNSKMPSVYYHFYGNEAVDELYKAKGYLQKDDIYDSNPIGLKKCPMCGYNNLPESLSCAHCKLLIDQVAFKQIIEEQYAKDTKLEEMTIQLQQMKENEKKQKQEMVHVAKDAVMNTINQMMKSGQIPSPFIMYGAYGNKDNLSDMPRIVAAGDEQVKSWEVEKIKSMSPKEREERKALLRSNKAFDELKAQEEIEKHFSLN